MTPNIHHIHIVSRYRQGQPTLISQEQSQCHEGRCCFIGDFSRFLRTTTILFCRLKTHSDVTLVTIAHT